MQNIDFELWDAGLPVGWSTVNEVIGGISDNVAVAQEAVIKTYGGNSSAKITSQTPCGGIQQSIISSDDPSFMAYPTTGKAAIHYSKENGLSADFTDRVLMQEHFMLPDPYNAISTTLRNPHCLRLDNGDYIELFSASTSGETTSEGAVYLKRNNSEPVLFRDDESVKNWTMPGVVDLGTKYTWINARYFASGEMKIYATDINRDFSVQSNDRILIEILNTNCQAYNFIKLSSGRIIIPMVYAAISQISTGPWYLDILYSDDNLETITRLNTPKTITGRGLMEAQPVLLSTGIVAILCRTNQGYIARADYNPIANTLSDASMTTILNVESGSFAKNLASGSIALSYLSTSTLRKVLVLMVSSDDMLTWQSFHIVSTSAAHGDSMATQPPYVHQPWFYEDIVNGVSTLKLYYEHVITTTNIALYRVDSSTYLRNNVANQVNNWQLLHIDNRPNAAYVQLLSIYSGNAVSYFDGMALPEPPAEPKLFTYANGGIIELPLVLATGAETNEILVVKGGIIHKLTLVETSDPAASPLKIIVNNTLKAIKKTVPPVPSTPLIVAASLTNSNPTICVSNDLGLNWTTYTLTGTTNQIRGIMISKNNPKKVIFSGSGTGTCPIIYHSDDLGLTFTPASISNTYNQHPNINQAGNIIYAIRGSAMALYKSTDSGDSFSNLNSDPISSPIRVVANEDGTRLFLSTKGSAAPLKNLNSGANGSWIGVTPPFGSTVVAYCAASADLGRIIIGNTNTVKTALIAITTDLGSTYTINKTIHTSVANCIPVISCSETGQHILVVISGDTPAPVYVSNDFGDTFNARTLTPSSQTWQAAVGSAGTNVSASGQYMIIPGGSVNLGIYLSTDYGATFQNIQIPGVTAALSAAAVQD